DRCFERVSGAAFFIARDSRKQSVAGSRNLVAGVEQEKRAGAVGVLRLSRSAASLTEQRRLLIAGNASDGNRLAEERRQRLAEIASRRPNLRKDLDRYVEQVAELLAPSQSRDVEQKSAGRVCRISRVHLPASELPDQPGVDRARQQPTIAGDECDLGFL